MSTGLHEKPSDPRLAAMQDFRNRIAMRCPFLFDMNNRLPMILMQVKKIAHLED
jgi:hypothetical protein